MFSQLNQGVVVKPILLSVIKAVRQINNVPYNNTRFKEWFLKGDLEWNFVDLKIQQGTRL